MENFVLKLDENIERSLQRFELVAIAKSWTSDQKVAFLRLSVNEELDSILSKACTKLVTSDKPQQEATENTPEKTYDRYMCFLVEHILGSDPKPNLSHVLKMEPKPGEDSTSFSSRLMSQLESCKTSLTYKELESFARSRLVETCPQEIRIIIELHGGDLKVTTRPIEVAKTKLKAKTHNILVTKESNNLDQRIDEILTYKLSQLNP